MRIVGRLLLVPIGLLFGALAGAMVLLTLGQEQIVRALHASGSDEAVIGILGIMLKIGIVLLNPQVLVAPLLIAIGGEVAHLRSATFYVAAFGAFAAMVPLLGQITAAPAGVVPGGIPFWALFATAGFVGGFVYWLIAGRTA